MKQGRRGHGAGGGGSSGGVGVEYSCALSSSPGAASWLTRARAPQEEAASRRPSEGGCRAPAAPRQASALHDMVVSWLTQSLGCDQAREGSRWPAQHPMQSWEAPDAVPRALIDCSSTRRATSAARKRCCAPPFKPSNPCSAHGKQRGQASCLLALQRCLQAIPLPAEGASAAAAAAAAAAAWLPAVPLLRLQRFYPLLHSSSQEETPCSRSAAVNSSSCSSRSSSCSREQQQEQQQP